MATTIAQPAGLARGRFVAPRATPIGRALRTLASRRAALTARNPRQIAVPLIDKEQRWLPMLAPHLPLAVPVPLATGGPIEEYPLPWAVVPWLEGEEATVERIHDLREAALAFARFIAALQTFAGVVAVPGVTVTV